MSTLYLPVLFSLVLMYPLVHSAVLPMVAKNSTKVEVKNQTNTTQLLNCTLEFKNRLDFVFPDSDILKDISFDGDSVGDEDSSKFNITDECLSILEEDMKIGTRAIATIVG